jgi:excisionase family DNA binding protein
MPISSDEWELWTWREVARALKASRSWVYSKAARGELPSLRVGGMLRFDPAAIRRFATTPAQGGTVVPLRNPGQTTEGA